MSAPDRSYCSRYDLNFAVLITSVSQVGLLRVENTHEISSRPLQKHPTSQAAGNMLIPRVTNISDKTYKLQSPLPFPLV